MADQENRVLSQKSFHRLNTGELESFSWFDSEWIDLFDKSLDLILSSESGKKNAGDIFLKANDCLNLLTLAMKQDSQLKIQEITEEGSIPVVLLYKKKDEGWEFLGKLWDFSKISPDYFIFSFDPSEYVNGNVVFKSGEGYKFELANKQ